MGGSFRLGRIAGIQIYIHSTFFLLLAGLFVLDLGSGTFGSATVKAVLLLALFGCVLLHELGHALTARLFGIRTRNITLLPIGGVARLERIPEKPAQELLITINGPLVNVLIVIVLGAILALTGGLTDMPADPAKAGAFLIGAGFLSQLMLTNVILVFFNLLPAFPMDGGRILRALLATFLDYPKATLIAARVGQGMAVLFVIAGTLLHWWLLLVVAVFVFLGARSEARSVALRAAFAGLRVANAMLTAFRTLSDRDSLAAARDALVSSPQQDFPVVATDGPQIGRVVGLLPADRLAAALAQAGPSSPVSAAMRRDIPQVDPRAGALETFQKMQELGCSALPVVAGGSLVGLVTARGLAELLSAREASARPRARS